MSEKYSFLKDIQDGYVESRNKIQCTIETDQTANSKADLSEPILFVPTCKAYNSIFPRILKIKTCHNKVGEIHDISIP